MTTPQINFLGDTIRTLRAARLHLRNNRHIAVPGPGGTPEHIKQLAKVERAIRLLCEANNELMDVYCAAADAAAPALVGKVRRWEI